MDKKKIEIFQTDNGQTDIRVQFEGESVWLNRQQLSELFDRDIKTVGKHINNVFRDGELDKRSTVAKFATVQTEGNREVERKVEHYNLDVIISVGYRVKSQRGTQFRIWATQRLGEYLVQGYAINQQRFDKNAAELQQALSLIKKAAQSPELNNDEGRGLVEIISRYTQTFLWLQRYDEGLLNDPQGQRGGELANPVEAMGVLNSLKVQLMARGEATDLFAKVRGDGLESIFGNLDQSVFGEPAYPTIESKAAHLLYFMVMYRMYCMQWSHGCERAVKNHPFSDGNKRSGAFLFVDFLHRNGRLLNEKGDMVINDTGLAALTLLVAESDPKQKETLIRLVMNMLSQGS